MPVRIRDLFDDHITVQVRCARCGKTYAYQGRTRLEWLGQKNMTLRELQRRLRCAGCGGPGELIMTIPQTTIERERRVSPVLRSDVKAGPPLWRWL